MRSQTLIAAALVLAACGTTATPTQDTSVADNGNDCAVITAVLRDHYGFGTEKPAPPVRLVSGFQPRCDWDRMGVTLAEPDSYRGLTFDRPKYTRSGSTIETSLVYGPLAGSGYVCSLRSGFAGWTVVGECQMTWVS